MIEILTEIIIRFREDWLANARSLCVALRITNLGLVDGQGNTTLKEIVLKDLERHG